VDFPAPRKPDTRVTGMGEEGEGEASVIGGEGRGSANANLMKDRRNIMFLTAIIVEGREVWRRKGSWGTKTGIWLRVRLVMCGFFSFWDV